MFKRFFCRWKEWETSQARLMGFTFNDRQCISAWSTIHELAQQVSHVSARSITSFFMLQPGASLEHCHIFTLSHILRRPIIVYGIKYLKSYQGDTLGFAKFQGSFNLFVFFVNIFHNFSTFFNSISRHQIFIKKNFEEKKIFTKGKKIKKLKYLIIS